MPGPLGVVFAVGSNQECGRVVIVHVAYETGSERVELLGAARDVVDHRFLVTVARATAGFGADHELIGFRVDHDALVLVPAPATIVVELDEFAACDRVRARQRHGGRCAHAAATGRDHSAASATRARGPTRGPAACWAAATGAHARRAAGCSATSRGSGRGSATRARSAGGAGRSSSAYGTGPRAARVRRAARGGGGAAAALRTTQGRKQAQQPGRCRNRTESHRSSP